MTLKHLGKKLHEAITVRYLSHESCWTFILKQKTNKNHAFLVLVTKRLLRTVLMRFTPFGWTTKAVTPFHSSLTRCSRVSLTKPLSKSILTKFETKIINPPVQITHEQKNKVRDARMECLDSWDLDRANYVPMNVLNTVLALTGAF